MDDNRLKPLSGTIKIRYTIKEHPRYGVKTGHFNTYEDFGEWLCRQYDKINIINISDKEE